MKLRKIFLMVALLTQVNFVAFTQPRQLSLQQAFDLALKNSKELKLSKANVEIAAAKLSQAKDKQWPEVKGSASYLRINTPGVKFANGEAGSSGQPGPLAALANIHALGLAQITVSQPIFTGFRIQNNRIMQQYLAEAAEYDETTTMNKVLVNTASALYQFYQLQETKRLLTQNHQHAQQRVAEFTNLEQQGLLARNDRLKAELQLNTIEYAQTEVEHNLELAEYSLGILLGLPEESQIELDTANMFHPRSLADADSFEAVALQNRSDIKSAQMQYQAAKAGTKIAKASRYPSLALSGGYVNAYIPNFLTVTNALNGGLGLQYNLSGLFHIKHLVQEAKGREVQAELSAAMTHDKARIEVRQKYLRYQESLQKIALNATAIQQAEENFSISKNKYAAGLMILSDYLDADVILLQKRIDYATAKANSMIAYYELQESIGKIQ
jgi:outer membrane protein